MSTIQLKYGSSAFAFEFDSRRFDVVDGAPPRRPLEDVEIGDAIDSPIASERLEDIIQPGEKVLFVVPDATRRTGAGQVVNLLVRRLIANGTMPYEMAVLIATGIHRGVTEEEKKEILTPFIVQRLKVFVHSATDLMKAAGLESSRFTDHGATSGGIAVSLNSMLTEYDRIVSVGGVSFHYFAGFTGGRKLICPGLASAETVAETHRLAFDFEKKVRREGVGPGLLAGNAVHEAFIEAAAKRPPDFAVNTIVDDNGNVARLFCGDWIASHEAACEAYMSDNHVAVTDKRAVVVVSCGGFPHDINMIQAHKAFDSASRICRDGGRIVLLAECRDGLGRKDFLEWFSAANAAQLAERLCSRYQVNGQTAWSLLEKAERFDVRVVTELPEAHAKEMRLVKATSLEHALGGLDANADGYILPNGAKTLVDIK